MSRYFSKISNKQAELDGWSPDMICKLPARATLFSAGYDIFAPYDITLNPGEEKKIPTFIRAVMNPDEFLMIVPRSGLGFKHYFRLANTVGIIDADYKDSDNNGHIWVKVRNESKDSTVVVKAGTAFCQGIFIKYNTTDDDKVTSERNGGFGSTTK